MARKAKYITKEGTKYCPTCQQVKSVSEFTGGYCKSCAKNYQWAYRNAETWLELRDLLLEAVEKYGPCSCDESDVTVLEVVPAERSQYMTLKRLKEAGYPPGSHMICLNCAMKERRKGITG